MHVSVQITALAVSAIYYLWRDVYIADRQKRACCLRQRVAYMLWAAALHDVQPEEPTTTPAAV
jgi:hypothetical protein